MLARLDWMTIKPKVILDIGSGTGEHSVRLQQRFPEALVISLDVTMPMLSQAQSKVNVNADTLVLPLGDQSVDLIFANFFYLGKMK